MLKDKTEHKNEKHAIICPKVQIIEPSVDKSNDATEKCSHKKAFMEATISIPTTINEESSRHNSLVPPQKLTPTPSMQAICEESREPSENISEKDMNKIEMLTFIVIAKANEDYSNEHADEKFKIPPENYDSY